ncbi:MAG: lytic murein transglycosylase, partial [Pseudolabrys sp.]
MQRSFFVAAILLTTGGMAAAQGGRVRFADVTGALPPPRPAHVHVNAPAWSGRSGASGDPRMTAQAIRAAAADFHQCLERMWPLAARHHVSRATFERYTRRLKPALRIMDLMDHQPEFTKSIWDYLDILVNDDRIEKGRALLAQYRPVFDRVERAYGVDRNVLAAIWGVESNYGTQGGNRPVLQSTATLACVGRRQKYFRREFVATLQILQHRDVPSDRLVGSWAGAFGPTQFMPSAFLRYAVDFDHDGRRDVVDSVADLMATTANKLKKAGWV